MFVEAYKKAAKFTHPVISTFRFYDGTVESGLGTFVILNDEGWIMTAGHILNAALAQQQHQLEIDNYKNKIQEIKDTPEFSGEKKDYF
jgi:S1-C subfamily serine protease